MNPQGFRLLQRFRLEGTTPIWTFACADALIEKRVWMRSGSNTTFVQYELVRGVAGEAEIEIKALVDCRDFHSVTRAGDWPAEIAAAGEGLPGLRVLVSSAPGAGPVPPFYLLSDLRLS